MTLPELLFQISAYALAFGIVYIAKFGGPVDETTITDKVCASIIVIAMGFIIMHGFISGLLMLTGGRI